MSNLFRAIAPRLTLYLTQDQSPVFHAIFLESLSCVEIGSKLANLVQLPSQHIMEVYVEGPCGIHVLVTDEVVQNMKDESMFMVELLPGTYFFTLQLCFVVHVLNNHY